VRARARQAARWIRSLPGTVDAPSPEPVVDGLPRRSKSLGSDRQGQPLFGT
jgi:hypothetical protein